MLDSQWADLLMCEDLEQNAYDCFGDAPTCLFCRKWKIIIRELRWEAIHPVRFLLWELTWWLKDGPSGWWDKQAWWLLFPFIVWINNLYYYEQEQVFSPFSDWIEKTVQFYGAGAVAARFTGGKGSLTGKSISGRAKLNFEWKAVRRRSWPRQMALVCLWVTGHRCHVQWAWLLFFPWLIVAALFAPGTRLLTYGMIFVSFLCDVQIN